VGGLPYDPLVIQNGLRFEDTVGGAPIDQHPLANAVALNVHDFSREPPLRYRGQCVPEASQLPVLTGERFVPHGPQLELVLLLAQESILDPERVAALDSFTQPARGGCRGTHRELDGVSGGLQHEAGLLQPAVTLVEEHDHNRKDRI
jgi:hypothetical protein